MGELQRKYQAYVLTSEAEVIVRDNVHDVLAKVPLPEYKNKEENFEAKEEWMREFNGLSDNMQEFIWSAIA